MKGKYWGGDPVSGEGRDGQKNMTLGAGPFLNVHWHWRRRGGKKRVHTLKVGDSRRVR